MVGFVQTQCVWLDALQAAGCARIFEDQILETVKIVLDLDRRGIGFRSLTESFDTKTALGRGVLALLAAVAEDERDRLRERTRAGMHAARRASKHVGRPRTVTPEQLDLARRLIGEGKGRHCPDGWRPSCHAAAGAERA
jgi:DNA invertase Pin-like site-specific DNA recombinase